MQLSYSFPVFRLGVAGWKLLAWVLVQKRLNSIKEEKQAREKQKIAWILLQLWHFFFFSDIHHSSMCRSQRALEKRVGTIEDVVCALPLSPWRGPGQQSPIESPAGRESRGVGWSWARELFFEDSLFNFFCCCSLRSEAHLGWEAAEVVWPVCWPWYAKRCSCAISSSVSQPGLVLVAELLGISKPHPGHCRGVWVGVRAFSGCPRVGIARLSAMSYVSEGLN